MRLVSLLFSPPLWTALISMTAYWTENPRRFVYDDTGSIKHNDVVKGVVPLSEVWTRDFWGTSLTVSSSHKSFRPLTTLTFRLNWILGADSEHLVNDGNGNMSPLPVVYGFHVVNVVLHGIVTLLVTYISYTVLQCTLLSTMAGLVFGLHPVHAESVSNVTSRGELLMSCFVLCGFCTYRIGVLHASGWKRVVCIFIVPWTCMLTAMLCKEQGATALMTCVVWDYLQHYTSILDWWRQRDWAFLRRTVILGLETLAVVALRVYWNGETVPDFIAEQNPAGFAPERFTRVLSVSWVYCLYLRDLVDPRFLCPDWSGISIELIESIDDVRILLVLALWAVVAWAFRSLLLDGDEPHRRVLLMAFWAFAFCPFLLSSNILVTVGFMKADRVLYLPLMGWSIFQAWVFGQLFVTKVEDKENNSDDSQRNRWYHHGSLSINPFGYLLFLAQMLFFCMTVHERNIAWSEPLRLWMSAYKVNPKSHHTQYNCGYELSKDKRYAESEVVLREIGDPHVQGPANTFIYAVVLYNLNRCPEAMELIQEAYKVVEEKQRTDQGPRAEKLNRAHSNLKIAESYCIDDFAEKGKVVWEAVQIDKTNGFAIQQAQGMMEQFNKMQEVMKHQQMMMQGGSMNRF